MNGGCEFTYGREAGEINTVAAWRKKVMLMGCLSRLEMPGNNFNQKPMLGHVTPDI
jgi:hypothetical protein